VTQNKVQVLAAATKARARVAQRKVTNQKILKIPRKTKKIKRPKTKKIKRIKRKRRNQNPKVKWALSKIK